MKKNLLIAIATFLLFLSNIFAEWNHAGTIFQFSNEDSLLTHGVGSFTGNSFYSTNPQGIVVDKEEKFWVAFYSTRGDEFLTANGDTVYTRPLWCFNPDGSVAHKIEFFDLPEGGRDTLWNRSDHSGTGRGISLDNAGNILYTSYATLYRFDYQTGRCLGRFISPDKGSMTEAVQDPENGFIYVGYLVPSGRPIYLLDEDLNMIGNAVNSTWQISRTLAVRTTSDGTHLYNGTCWSGNGVMHWFSANPEFEEFVLVDTLGNLDEYVTDSTIYYDVKLWSSSLDWTPDGNLLVGSLRQSWAGPLGSKWWIMDPITGELIESFGIPVDDEYANDPEGFYLGGGTNGPRGGYFTDPYTLYTVDFYLNTLDKWTGFPTLAEEWGAQVQIYTSELSDINNNISTSFSATDEFDQGFDIPEPPPAVSNYLQLCFTHNDWDSPTNRLSTDIRYPINLLFFQQKWDFSVFTDQVGELHTIKVTNLNGINWDVGIYIVDLVSEEIIQLSSATDYVTFTPDEAGEYRYQILVGRLYPVQEIGKTFKAGWNMVGLPLKPLTNSYSDIFGDDIINKGYIYCYNGNSGYYETDYLQQGKGYWLGLLSDENLIYIGDSIATSVTVSLTKGNNLISNPYKYTIGTQNMSFTRDGTTYSFSEAVLNGWLSGAIHHWENDATATYMTTDSIGQWWGVWIYALMDEITLNFEPGKYIEPDNVNTKKISENGWMIEFELSSQWGTDLSGAFGLSEDAQDDFDAIYDYPDPPIPPAGDYLTGYFRHDDWNDLGPRFDRDIRGIDQDYIVWEYTIESSQNGYITLTWDHDALSRIMGNISLVDHTAGTTVDMVTGNEYTFHYSGKRVLEFIYSFSGSVDKEQLPTVYAISQNYPNPFNPVTTIDYQLPEESNVKIRIYNLRGQLITTLVNQIQPAGYYRVKWDAHNVGTGIYLYRIQAGSFTTVKKCIVIK